MKKKTIPRNAFNQGSESPIHWNLSIYKTLREQTEEETNKWKDILSSWIGRINIVKMSIVHKAIYRFNTVAINIPMAIFTDIQQTILKFACNKKRPWITKAILRKNKAEGITLPYFKVYYKVIIIKLDGFSIKTDT